MRHLTSFVSLTVIIAFPTMLLLREGSGYPAENTAQTQRDKTTQRKKTPRTSFLCVADSSWLRGSRIVRAKRMSPTFANYSHSFPSPFSSLQNSQFVFRSQATGLAVTHL